jgi:hypothetical protein
MDGDCDGFHQRGVVETQAVRQCHQHVGVDVPKPLQRTG